MDRGRAYANGGGKAAPAKPAHMSHAAAGNRGLTRSAPA